MKIELKRWDETNLDAVSDIFTRCNRNYLSDSLPIPYTREHAENWFNSTVCEKEGKSGLFRIVYADHAAAGVITLQCGEGCYACDADIGYVLLDEFKGQGVMTRTVEMFCREAFETLDILRISARIFAPNIASQRVLEKNGFDLEGCLRRAVLKGNDIYDMYLFGKLK